MDKLVASNLQLVTRVGTACGKLAPGYFNLPREFVGDSSRYVTPGTHLTVVGYKANKLAWIVQDPFPL